MKAIYWTSLFSLVLFACSPTKESGYGHLSKIKAHKLKETSNLPLDFVFYRSSKTDCKLYYKVNPKFLLRKKDSLGRFSTHFQIQFEIKNKSNFKKSIEYLIEDSLPKLDSIVFTSAENVNLPYELQISDLNKHTIQKRKATWSREAGCISEDFLFVDNKTKKPLVSDFIYGGEIDIKTSLSNREFKLKYSSSHQEPSKSMYELRRDENNLDSPHLIDSTLPLNEIVELINSRETETHFIISAVSDESKNAGSANITKLLHSDKPTVDPLVYLQRDESVTISSWVSFWSEASAEDLQKAEKLIKEFNRRVEYANIHFSSHKLGWKTDRGMLYILFGPSDRVIKDVRSELWSYGFTNSVQREFVFEKDWFVGPNNFSLERNLGYYEIEISAIQRWKNGWVRYGLDGNQ